MARPDWAKEITVFAIAPSQHLPASRTVDIRPQKYIMHVMGKTNITGGYEMNTENSDIKRIPGKRLTPSQFRRKMGDYLARVQYGKETLVIATRGKRHAIICPPVNWCPTENRSSRKPKD
jgi:hypothetical protein